MMRGSDRQDKDPRHCVNKQGEATTPGHHAMPHRQVLRMAASRYAHYTPTLPGGCRDAQHCPSWLADWYTECTRDQQQQQRSKFMPRSRQTAYRASSCSMLLPPPPPLLLPPPLLVPESRATSASMASALASSAAASCCRRWAPMLPRYLQEEGTAHRGCG